MDQNLPPKVLEQIRNAELPTSGKEAFVPRLGKNRRGDVIIEKAMILFGPKQGKKGYVDIHGRIWIKDRAHAGDADHWDVQLDEGKDYLRVSLDGEPI